MLHATAITLFKPLLPVTSNHFINRQVSPGSTVQTSIKGTVARDFWPLVFFMNRPHMTP
jgi:hypothetical protein